MTFFLWDTSRLLTHGSPSRPTLGTEQHTVQNNVISSRHVLALFFVFGSDRSSCFGSLLSKRSGGQTTNDKRVRISGVTQIDERPSAKEQGRRSVAVSAKGAQGRRSVMK